MAKCSSKVLNKHFIRIQVQFSIPIPLTYLDLSTCILLLCVCLSVWLPLVPALATAWNPHACHEVRLSRFKLTEVDRVVAVGRVELENGKTNLEFCDAVS